MSNYTHLLAPARIGTLELKNRLFQTAMGTNLAHADGTISDEIVAFYAARAAGGAALVTMGAVGVSYPHGQVQSHQVGISDDRFLPGLKRITDAVHRNGGRISAQLHHGGLSAACDMVAGRTIALPSMPRLTGGASMKDTLLPEELALSHFGGGVRPSFKAMTLEDIARLIEREAHGVGARTGIGRLQGDEDHRCCGRGTDGGADPRLPARNRPHPDVLTRRRCVRDRPVRRIAQRPIDESRPRLRGGHVPQGLDQWIEWVSAHVG